jgi:hypothetical protein
VAIAHVARLWACSLVFALVAPPLVVGLVGLGSPWWMAVAAGGVLAAGTSWWAAPRLTGIVAAALPRRAIPLIALALATLVLLSPYVRLSVYMADASRTSFAFFRASPFWLYHSCFTAYIEADRLARDPSQNIYAASQYENRSIGPFKVDTYYYPPSFLVQTRIVAALADGFLARRALWYALQCLTLTAVALFVSAWVGGRKGGLALLLLPLLYSAQPTLAGLQYGNVQVTAVTTSTLGVLLIASARPAAGGALLALATVSKIFPALLGVLLLASRRWRGALWTAGWSAALLALAYLLVGAKPFTDFLHDALPRIHDLSAFPQAEWPRAAAVNLGIYGATVKLRHLGLSWLDASAGRQVTDIYGLLLVAVTVLLGWREWRRPWNFASADDRARALQLWLALVGLASYRSPFVGFAYGGASTMWLIWLLTASGRRPAGVWAGVAAFAVTAWGTSLVRPRAGGLPPARELAASLVIQLAMLGVNLAVVAGALRRPPPRPEPAGVSAEASSYGRGEGLG